MSTVNWIRTDEHRPPVGREVLAMDSGGHVQRLVLQDGLWWLPDRSMYVYFTPMFWREAGDE